MDIEGYERNEAEEAVKNDEAWLNIDELKALVED